MDKATPTLRQRCDTALQSLPDAPYRAMLAALFDEMLAEVERLAAQAAPTDTEMVLVPPWKGYALLGTGNYILNSSAAPPDPKLGAEFFITFATDADKSGNRQVGETRANDPNAAPVQPEEMVLRIGFLTPQALCALEGQLRVLREENFPESVAAQPSQAPVVQAVPENCGTGYCSCIECVVEPEAVQTEVRFKYESMKPIDGYDAIYAEYATTFGRYPDDFMSKVVRQTKEDLFMWWGAHREKIRAGLVLLAAQEDASSGATTQAIPFSKDSWQHAVDNQLVAFGRTSQEFANPHEALAWLAIMNMELGQSNAGATTQAVRFMTSDDCQEHIGRTWLTHEEDAAIAAFCAVNAGRTIPADGKIGGV